MSNDRTSKVIQLFEGTELPPSDNTPEELKIFRAANERYRQVAWPVPFDKTEHRIAEGDARDLSLVPNESVHLVVTSPPYWTLKEYTSSRGQLGEIEDYEAFLGELDKVWAECKRVLVPGGRVCCVVGDVCIPRKKIGKHFVMPLHADIQVRSRALGLDVLPLLLHTRLSGASGARHSLRPLFSRGPRFPSSARARPRRGALLAV